MPSITVHAYDHGTTVSAPLADVWIYWKLGGDVTFLRTDAAGLLHKADLTATAAEKYPTNEMPWVYTADFDVTRGTTVDVAFSRGAKPIHPNQLPTGHYTKVVVGDPWPAPFHAPPNTTAEELWIQIGAPNAIGSMFTLDILIPNHRSELTSPKELSLWPLLRDVIPDNDPFYTDGLAQGAALWTSNTSFAGEDEAVAALAADKRPREVGLHVTGSVENRVKELEISLLDSRGLPVLLKTSATSSHTVSLVKATLSPGGTMQTFTADFWIGRPEVALGAVQILYQTKGAAPDYSDAYFLQLTGVQLALVDDYLSGDVSGAKPGPVPTEADDRMIVDFKRSPKTTLAGLQAETRARRMVPYSQHLRRRPFSATLPTPVEMPEMPLWMAETQLVGLGKTGLRELLDFRKNLLPAKPDSLVIGCELELVLAWDGPDVDVLCKHDRSYFYADAWNSRVQTATLKIDKDFEVTAALDPEPKAVAFPVDKRRKAAVHFDKARRRWGRHAGASEVDALVIEWQPKITDSGSGEEILRGGDGVLTLETLTIGGDAVKPPAVDDPIARLPKFRVRGANPVADTTAIIELVVEEFYNANSAKPYVTALSLNTWKYTVRKIIRHEARDRQFGFLSKHYGIGEDGGVDYFYGLQSYMPLFGYPHGYGMAQLDDPRVTSDGAWSFVGNLRGAAKLLMEGKASETNALLSQHKEDTDHWRACFQRDVIKQYNSGVHEVAWLGGAWKVSPESKKMKEIDGVMKANPELQYPNLVLDDQVDVVYWTGTELAPVFNWPITLAEGNYGDLPD